MRVVLLSDTHDRHRQITVPEGDLLIHAGDMTKSGTVEQITEFNDWLGTLPHPNRVVIGGNHDFLLEDSPELGRSLITNAIYLEEEEVVIGGHKIFGSPYTPWFHDWAFNVKSKDRLAKHWAKIPKDVSILVTHGPPYGILDQTIDFRNVGCEKLFDRVMELKPKLHVFGHIHEGRGSKVIGPTLFVNACICTLSYRPDNRPVVVDL